MGRPDRKNRSINQKNKAFISMIKALFYLTKMIDAYLPICTKKERKIR